jgi:hypothetical protein
MSTLSRRALLRAGGAGSVVLATGGLVAALPTNAAANLNTMTDTTEVAATFTVGPRTYRSGWRHCNKCQCFWDNTHKSGGRCPAGGSHDPTGSPNCGCSINPGKNKEYGWKWCHKCWCCWSGDPHGSCPAGDSHNGSDSPIFFPEYGEPPTSGPTKYWDDWSKCNKCCGCCSDEGPCAGGGEHDWTGSKNYYFPIYSQ